MLPPGPGSFWSGQSWLSEKVKQENGSDLVYMHLSPLRKNLICTADFHYNVNTEIEALVGAQEDGTIVVLCFFFFLLQQQKKKSVHSANNTI